MRESANGLWSVRQIMMAVGFVSAHTRTHTNRIHSVDKYQSTDLSAQNIVTYYNLLQHWRKAANPDMNHMIINYPNLRFYSDS